MEELIELNYRSPKTPVMSKLSKARIEELKLEIMARNPVGIMVPMPENYPYPPVDLDPESFNPRKGIMTRYGKKLLEEGAKFYKRVSIKL